MRDTVKPSDNFSPSQCSFTHKHIFNEPIYVLEQMSAIVNLGIKILVLGR